MSGPRFRTLVCRRTSSAGLLAISLLTISALPISPVLAAGAAPASSTATADPASTPGAAPGRPLTITLAEVAPTVAVPRSAVKITGSVRNSGGVAISTPVARALIGQGLSSRQAVSDWATTKAEPPMDEVARVPVGKVLPPGGVAVFTLTIPAGLIGQSLAGEAFAVLPLRVEVAGTTSTGSQQSGDVHTFLPALASIKRFEPVSIAWLVPLTLDPDPELQGPPSAARTSAWKRAIGPGSRLERVIQGTENANVTWAVDPAILGPQKTPLGVRTSATPSPSPSPSTSPTPRASQPAQPGTAPGLDPVTGQTSALADRLKAASPGHILWSLPYADPDLAAFLHLPSGNQVLNSVISHPSTLDVSVGPARADIAWPVAGALTPSRQARLKQTFASTRLAAAVTSASTLNSPNDTGNATRKASSGLPLLAYDEPLSRIAATATKGTGPITTQRFLADSMALLGERPGTPNRSVLVAVPRTFDPDPVVLRSLFAAVAQAKWLSPATTGQLLSASQKAAPETSLSDANVTTLGPASRPSASDPMNPGISPLTPDQVATIPVTLSDIGGIASILGNGQSFTNTWTDAQVQKLSARWRGHPEGPVALDTATQAAIDNVSRNVRVAPSEVNFLADRGVMQVTVINDLPVAIHDVHLTLTPAQPRLRIERQPPPLKIGARAKATVRFPVTSIAAGLVSVNAALTTPSGTPLGQDAILNVRVQPPASWIYWVLGGLAGVVLVLGTQRSLRRGSTRASRPDGQEPPLND